MIHTIDERKKSLSWQFAVAAVIIILFVICAGYTSSAQAAGKVPQQRSYASPEEAVKSLLDAVKANDLKALRAILGPDSNKLISSGDDVADSQGRGKFVKAYEEKSRIEMVGNTKAVLSIGEKDWPLPIPIVKKGKTWRFDTKAGKEEMVNRRIGRNELSTIQTCLAIVDAQKEYALNDNDGDGLLEYAQKFWSDPGKKNGLYWETKEGEDPSPLGPLAAEAAKGGYETKTFAEKPTPYHGYYFKILKSQGKHAPGGAYDYVVKGKMIGGFALVAYPAIYGTSGIMTFVVNQDGVVYQKCLGKNTDKIAGAIKLFDPDKTWKKVETQ